MSQEDITLQLLREAGARGLHTFEMRKAFIGNPSERIARLELRGHRIRVGDREKLNGGAVGVRYFLEHDAERACEKRSGVALGGDQLAGSLNADTSSSLFDASAYTPASQRYRDVA